MKSFAGLRMKLNHFHKLLDGSRNWNTADEDRMPIRPEWTTVDRILDTRFWLLNSEMSLRDLCFYHIPYVGLLLCGPFIIVILFD